MGAITIHDLNPQPAYFLLKKKRYKLKKFSLAARVWARFEFATPENEDGLEVLSHKMAKLDPHTIGKVGYYLLENHEDFVNEKDFIESFKFSNILIEILLPTINETIGASQPTDDEIEESAELKK